MKFLFLFFYNFIDNLIHIRRIKNFMKKNVTLSKPIIFDVGSHKGKMTRLFRNLYKNAKIYCFEPNIEIVKSLKKINKNTIIYNLALGNKNEKKKINLSSIDLTNSLAKIDNNSFYLKIKNFILGKQKKKHSTSVKVTTLNNFCKNRKIKKIDFLKIDVEGYEHMVLLGSKGIIHNVKYIMIEIQENDQYTNYSKQKIEKFLKINNFKLLKKFNFPFMFFQDRIYKKFKK